MLYFVIGNSTVLQACKYCHNQFSEGNYTIKLLPKTKLTSKIRRLVARSETSPYSLGKFQQKLVKDYSECANKLVRILLRFILILYILSFIK